MSGKFVSYLRVSTEKQGRSGLGIEAQQKAVNSYLSAYLEAVSPKLIGEYIETESGKKSDRPRLAEALAHCNMTGATLIVAKLDRLARNARFLLSVVEGSGNGGVAFCDFPTVPVGPVGKFMITQMAAAAELEGGMISVRTRDALAVAKLRGTKLGGWRGGPVVNPALGRAAQVRRADSYAKDTGSIAAELRSKGMSLRQIAAQMEANGLSRPRGGAWTADAVSTLLARHQAG